MSKSVCALAMLAALGAATPALAQPGERDNAYSTQSHFGGFPYRPFSLQIEGGTTLTEGMESQDLGRGENIGLGFTWRPTSHLPLALRVDGMYEHFHDRPALLAQAAAGLGTTVDWGNTKLWGGDVDAELDTLLSPRVRLYFLAGGGWYDRRESFYQYGIGEGVFCGWSFCEIEPVFASFRVGQVTTGMQFEKNAGAGLEFALGEGASLFIDARYMRFDEQGQKLDFVPVRIGLRF
jgi:opacity protein-like surface antigen